jgi:hypothetical protein
MLRSVWTCAVDCVPLRRRHRCGVGGLWAGRLGGLELLHRCNQFLLLLFFLGVVLRLQLLLGLEARHLLRIR